MPRIARQFGGAFSFRPGDASVKWLPPPADNRHGSRERTMPIPFATRRATECQPRAVASRRLIAAARVLLLGVSFAASAASAAPGPHASERALAAGPNKPAIYSITLRDSRFAVARRMTPRDTFFVDAYVADSSGFRNVDDIQIAISLGNVGANPSTWQGARFRWQRDETQPWTLESSNSVGWRVLRSLSVVDSATNSTSPQLVRMAFVPSSVARADTSDWQIQVWVSPVTLKQTGYGMNERIEWVALPAGGAFAAGQAGMRDLPLTQPTTGLLDWRLVTNTRTWLVARSSSFDGQSTDVRFGGGTSDTTLRWLSSTPGVRPSGYLDSLAASLADSIPAFSDTTARTVSLGLRLAIPSGTPAQDYRGTLTLDAESRAGTRVSRALELEATVIGSGLAGSGIAEVYPHRVTAGSTGVSMNALLGLTVSAGETGVNRVRVAMPAGWSSPRVTSVTTLLGFPIAFHDASTASSAVAALHSTRSTGTFRVTFAADAPTAADSLGSPFTVYFDDTTTTVPEQVATEGNPDLIGDSGWMVAVDPATAAMLAVTPVLAQRLVGETVDFAVVITDVHGNRRFDAVSWSESGGAGSVDATGHYVAGAAGTSLVIARSGPLADTGTVVVSDLAASATVSLSPVTSGRLLPAGAAWDVALVRVQNPGSVADTLDAIELLDASVGPATAKQRELSWSRFEALTSSGARLASAYLGGDRVGFEGVGLAVPAGTSRLLRIVAGASRTARDGDSLGLTLGDGVRVAMRSGRPATLELPGAVSRFPVDGMSAAQVALEPRGSGPLFGGVRRRPVAALRVPGNGYASDRLRRMSLQNLGTAEAGLDLERFELWVDDGNGALDTLADARLGALQFTGDRWEISGLAFDVPDTGKVLFVTADVAAAARDGRTVRLAVPTLPDVGLGMNSGNSGPIDAAVSTGRDEIIGAGERVMVTASPVAGGATQAGATNVPLLELVVVNGYATDRTLRSFVLSNTTAGAGTPAQRDATFARLVLTQEGFDLQPPGVAVMPHAVSSFQNGRATFDGLGLVVPAGGVLRLTVSGDVDPALAADGDLLSASLDSPQDVTFEEASTVGGKWPARSGATWVVDGMVATQLVKRDVAGLTLAPGDGPVPALDVRVPGNGYMADVLHGLRVENRGDADPTEIAEIRLYRDGGDGRPGGVPSDDADLGPLVRIGSQWQSPYLNEPLPANGARFFFGVEVAGTTSDSSTVRLAVPKDGVDVESGNDGPLDAEVANDEPHVLSTRPLLASLAFDPASSTIGQQVDLEMTVRNAGSEPFDNVQPGALDPEGTAAYTVLSGPTPGPSRLLPGESATFTWRLAPTSAGELRFAGTASGLGETSSLERRTLVASSGVHVVYMESDSLRLVTQQSMPSAVNVGQTGVVPLTMTLEHPGDGSSSDIRFRRLRVRLEQEDGSPVVPANLASAVEVREGTTVYLQRTSLETSGDVMDLTLATPATLRPGDPVSLALRLDIAANTAVPSFRLVVDDSSGFVADDAISGRPVRVRLQGQNYPVRSGLARLLSGGGALALSAPAPVERRASAGQNAVTLAAWQVTHSSALPTSADLRLNSVFVRATTVSGPAAPSPWVRWRVLADGLVVAQRNASPADTGDVRFDLVPAPIVQPGAPVTLRFEADLAANSAGRAFTLDATRTPEWDVRDVNSGDPAPLLAPQPVLGDTVRIESPASQVMVTPVARMPALVAAGRVRLPVLDLLVRHPGPAGVADVRVDSLRVSLRAPDGSALPLGTHLSAVRVTRRGLTLAEVLNPGGTEAMLAPACRRPAGSLDTLTVELDVAGNAPASTIELSMAAGSMRAWDANSGAAAAVMPESPADWPFGSGSAQIVAPARELRVSLRSTLPAMLAASATGFTGAATMVLHHPGPAASGPIAVDHVVIRASDPAGAALPLGGVAAVLELRRGGTLVAQSAALSADSLVATLRFATPVEVASNDSVHFDLALRPRATDTAMRFRAGWRADGIGVVQPTSALLAVAVVPEAGEAFPMWTQVAGFAADGLEASVANFPNPFAAGRDATTFAWNMPAPGRVTLRIFTARGQPVITLLDGAAIGAGPRQADRWDGRNGRGDVVANGVYVAEIDVTLDDGRRERVLRKVAVVR